MLYEFYIVLLHLRIPSVSERKIDFGTQPWNDIKALPNIVAKDERNWSPNNETWRDERDEFDDAIFMWVKSI